MPASRLGASAVGWCQSKSMRNMLNVQKEQYGIYLMYNLPEKIHLRISRRGDTRTLWSKNELLHQLFQHL